MENDFILEASGRPPGSKNKPKAAAAKAPAKTSKKKKVVVPRTPTGEVRAAMKKLKPGDPARIKLSRKLNTMLEKNHGKTPASKAAAKRGKLMRGKVRKKTSPATKKKQSLAAKLIWKAVKAGAVKRKTRSGATYKPNQTVAKKTVAKKTVAKKTARRSAKI